MPDLISVIVTTYNRPDALAAVFKSLAGQSDAEFEVVVADDGSGAETADMIESWKVRLGRPLFHVRHEHRGFRAAEIRNRGIAQAQGNYCVLIDGDCVARPDFIAVHRRLAEPGWFVTGNRILLSPELTERVLREGLAAEGWTFTQWVAARARGEINRVAGVIRLPLGPLRRLRPRQWRDARSCNIGIWRADLAQIDGFDGGYQGWGREDSDLIIRLLRSGVRRKDGTFATGVLHLWHPSADRAGMEDNERRLQELVGGDRIRARQGLSSLAIAPRE